MKGPEPHPLAELFPPLPDKDLGELADDICTFGLRNPIILYEGQVLDGRNRLAACRIAGVEPEFTEYEGDEPLYFVLSHNLHRRHLTESQRAMVAARIVDWDRGLNQHSAGGANLPAHKAAEKLSISERAVKAARRIHERGVPALVEAIRDGRLSVHAGEALSDLECAAQLEVLERERSEIIKQAKSIRADRQKENRERRLRRLATIANGNSTVVGKLPKGAFPVIYADPAWPNDVWNEDNGQDKAYPYPTMALDDIKALCAGENTPATADAVLFLWTTGNRIAFGVDVCRAWGFEPVSSIVWDKVTIGTGRWVRDRHEILIVATRGKVPCPLPGTQAESLFSERKGEHSVKPECVRWLIERYFPDVPKLELFARKQADGWAVWGNEVAG